MRISFLSFLIFTFMAVSTFAQKRLMVFGANVVQNEAYVALFKKNGLQATIISSVGLNTLKPQNGDMLVILADQIFPSESQRSISSLLASGGHVVVIGKGSFNDQPLAKNKVPLVQFGNGQDYQLIYPKREKPNTSFEAPKIEIVKDPQHNSAIRFSTLKKGMKDLMVQFSAKKVASEKRTVLNFWAKGNAYMDLLAIEIIDREKRKWFGFVPLTADWKQYDLSLADFMPENWKDPNKPYPLLQPSAIDSVAMGTNMMTVWREKGMDFSIGSINLAENKQGSYMPSLLLQKMRYPFLANGIKIPTWQFDPFFESIPFSATQTFQRSEIYPFGKQAIALKTPVRGWSIRPFIEQPATLTGTDTREDYKMAKLRAVKRISLLKQSGNVALGNVAETRFFTEREGRGSGISLFGLLPSDILASPILSEILIRTIKYTREAPKILSANINTTPTPTVTPLLRVVIQNPTAQPLQVKLLVNVANKQLEGKTMLTIAPYQTTTDSVILNAVPKDFRFENFSLKVTLESSAGNDIFIDSVNVERSLIKAIKHIVEVQKNYPDGRYTNHYFGDAYGVRAIAAYVKYLNENPKITANNKDLWREITPQEMSKSLMQFCKMLVDRQNADGAVPMGYSEHAGGYNVADGGQIAISIGHVAALTTDSLQRKQYLDFCKRFLDWAETFYITDSLAKKMRTDFPEAAAKGQAEAGLYGLGMSGKSRISTGPAWVLSDLIGAQILMANLDSNSKYRKIADRNSRFYLKKNYPTSGYYQAEALFWIWMDAKDEKIKQAVAEKLKSELLPSMLTGKAREVYDLGGRNTLKALPLIYYRRNISDTESVRAALLKYIWSFGAENSSDAIAQLSEAFPKPVHGESLAVTKYLELSALWAIELLRPGSTLIDFSGAKK